jgi:hypothetical protein
MPRKAQPRIVRPSGIEQSANGSYFYWKCNVSGKETFAPEPRFKDVVKNYGSEEKLFKEYVLRPVQKYVDAGFDADTIKTIMENNDGVLPPLDKKPIKEQKEKRRSVKNLSVGEIEVSSQPDEPKVQIFPWSGNPDYFRSAPSAFKIEDETKNACVYPNRNLNDQCHGCSIYDQCHSSAKYSKEDMKKPRTQVKIKPVDVYA